MVVDREFLAGDNALMVPKTADGRVLFAVPWLGKVILGTTDTPRSDLAREPAPFDEGQGLGQGTDPRRCAQRLGRAAAAGQAAG